MGQDCPTGAPKLGAGKSRGRPPGPHWATVEHGRRIGAILATGTPLNFVAETLGINAKTLRRQLKAVDRADGRPTSRRSMADLQAVSYAIRRLREHDEEHPEAFFEPETRTPEALERHANRLERVVELCRVQAAASGERRAASGEAHDLRSLEGSVAHLRAEAEADAP